MLQQTGCQKKKIIWSYVLTMLTKLLISMKITKLLISWIPAALVPTRPVLTCQQSLKRPNGVKFGVLARWKLGYVISISHRLDLVTEELNVVWLVWVLELVLDTTLLFPQSGYSAILSEKQRGPGVSELAPLLFDSR